MRMEESLVGLTHEGCLIGGYDKNDVLYVNLYLNPEHLPGVYSLTLKIALLSSRDGANFASTSLQTLETSAILMR